MVEGFATWHSWRSDYLLLLSNYVDVADPMVNRLWYINKRAFGILEQDAHVEHVVIDINRAIIAYVIPLTNVDGPLVWLNTRSFYIDQIY